MYSGKRKVIGAIGIVIAITLCVLAGWQFEIEYLKRIIPGLVVMNPLSAVAFLLAALSLILIPLKGKHLNLLINFIAITVALIGMIRLYDYATYFTLDIDTWLFANKINNETSKPNRMAPNTALSFFLLGFTIVYLNKKRAKAFLADYFAAIVFFIGFLSIVGYLYNARELYGIENYMPMALHTSVCFCLLSYVVFCFKKDEGFVKDFTSRHGGRQIAIILIPMALCIPLLLGFFRLKVEEAGYLSSTLSTAMVAIGNCMIMLFFTSMIARSINQSKRLLIKEMATRKKIEEELRKNNRIMDEILDNIPDKFFVKDAKNLHYLRVNNALEDLLQRKRHDIVGKTDYDLFSKEEADGFTKVDREVVISGKMIVVPEEKIKTGENEVWFNTKKFAIKDSNGKPLFVVGIARNITEQKKQNERFRQFNKELEQKVHERTRELNKSEQRYRALIESGIDAIKMMDEEGTIFYASETHLSILGFKPQEMMLTSWFEYIHPDDIQECNQVMKKVLSKKGVPIQSLLRVRHKNNSYLFMQGTITNFIHDENVKAIVCNFHDVSEREKLHVEKLLLAKEVTAEKINKEKQIAQAAIDGEERERTAIGMELHDNINQILGAVKLYIGMAKSRSDLTMEMLEKSEENLAICINEVRRLSKALVSPNLKMGLSNSIADLVEGLKQSLNIKIHLSEDEELFHIIDDRTQLTLYRIVQEQLNNIIKHAGASNVTICITKKEESLILKIADDGKGFDPASTHKGIGLKNIANRVEFLKGTLQITSARNKGCTVSINVPIHELQLSE